MRAVIFFIFISLLGVAQAKDLQDPCYAHLASLGVHIIQTKHGPRVVYEQFSLGRAAQPGRPVIHSAAELDHPPVPYVTPDRLLWFSVGALPESLALKHGEVPIVVSGGEVEIQKLDNHLRIDEKWELQNGKINNISIQMYIEDELLGVIFFNPDGSFRAGYRNLDFPDEKIDIYFEHPQNIRNLLADGNTKILPDRPLLAMELRPARPPLNPQVGIEVRQLLSQGLWIPRQHPSFAGTETNPSFGDVWIQREYVRTPDTTEVRNVKAKEDWIDSRGNSVTVSSAEASPADDIESGQPEVMNSRFATADPRDFQASPVVAASGRRTRPSPRAELILDLTQENAPPEALSPPKRVYMEVRRGRSNPDKDKLTVTLYEGTRTALYQPSSFDSGEPSVEVSEAWEYRVIGETSTFLAGHYDPSFLSWSEDYRREIILGSVPYDIQPIISTLAERFRDPYSFPVEEREDADFLDWRAVSLPLSSVLIEEVRTDASTTRIWMNKKRLPDGRISIDIYEEERVVLYSLEANGRTREAREYKLIGSSSAFKAGQERPDIEWHLSNDDQLRSDGRARHFEEVINERLNTRDRELRIAN